MTILESKSEVLKQKLQDLPKTPGCYVFSDKNNKIIYIGKAINLSNRVKSYFANFFQLEIAKQRMIEKAVDLTTYSVDSEFEALLLESNLIKKYRPRYNIVLRDDKNYIFIRLESVRKAGQKIPTTNSPFQDFPTISITREKKADGAEYFGPFPSTTPVKRILKKIRKVFPYCSSTKLIYQKSKDPLEIHLENSKPCFHYHLGLCKGACIGLESKEEYVKRFNNIRKFFKGQKEEIVQDLEKQMLQASKELRFEEAAILRNKVNDIKYVTYNIRIDSKVDDVVINDLKTKERANSIERLIEELEFPPEKLKTHKDFRIECYDISNIQGTNAVGAMTVMIDGEVKPEFYRRFKIRMKNEPNDFAMLQEVLSRRFRQYLMNNYESFIEDSSTSSEEERRASEEFKQIAKKAKAWKQDESFIQKPDLIIIDGGKGQLASTYKILYNFGLHNEIPMVGLAKKQEEIFKVTDQFKDDFNQINDSSKFTRILLPKRSESLYLVQRIRDEAHRFGITYHRKLRSKTFLKS